MAATEAAAAMDPSVMPVVVMLIPSRASVTLQVAPAESVAAVKAKIREHTGPLPARHRLLLAGGELQDHQRLSEHHVPKESTLQLVCQGLFPSARYVCEGLVVRVTDDLAVLTREWQASELGPHDQLEAYCGHVGVVVELDDSDGTCQLRWGNWDQAWMPVRACEAADGAELTLPVLEDAPAPVLQRGPEEQKDMSEAAAGWSAFAATASYRQERAQVEVSIRRESSRQEQASQAFPEVTAENVERVAAAAQAARDFTRSVEETPVNADRPDRDTLLKVLLANAREEGRPCLFFDSSQGGAAAASPGARGVTDFLLGSAPGASGEKKAVLKLRDASGLAGTEGQSAEQAVCEMATAIKCGQPHPALTDVRQRLARAYQVAVDSVRITGVHLGSCCFQFTIDKCPVYFCEGQCVIILKEQFDQFAALRVHPMLVQAQFDVNDFDLAGFKSFVQEKSKYQVGPPGRQQTYEQPHGWTRYGLKVLDGRFGQDHTWLHPFRHQNNWWRAFHGTSAAVGELVRHGSADYPAQFKPGRHQAHEGAPCLNHPGQTVARGVYCSPVPASAEIYSKATTVETQQGPVRFKFMFQCCVDPQAVCISQRRRDYWVVPDDKLDRIRPYGVLLKRA